MQCGSIAPDVAQSLQTCQPMLQLASAAHAAVLGTGLPASHAATVNAAGIIARARVQQYASDPSLFTKDLAALKSGGKGPSGSVWTNLRSMVATGAKDAVAAVEANPALAEEAGEAAVEALSYSQPIVGAVEGSSRAASYAMEDAGMGVGEACERIDGLRSQAMLLLHRAGRVETLTKLTGGSLRMLSASHGIRRICFPSLSLHGTLHDALTGDVLQAHVSAGPGHVMVLGHLCNSTLHLHAYTSYTLLSHAAVSCRDPHFSHSMRAVYELAQRHYGVHESGQRHGVQDRDGKTGMLDSSEAKGEGRRAALAAWVEQHCEAACLKNAGGSQGHASGSSAPHLSERGSKQARLRARLEHMVALAGPLVDLQC